MYFRKVREAEMRRRERAGVDVVWTVGVLLVERG